MLPLSSCTTYVRTKMNCRLKCAKAGSLVLHPRMLKCHKDGKRPSWGHSSRCPSHCWGSMEPTWGVVDKAYLWGFAYCFTTSHCEAEIWGLCATYVEIQSVTGDDNYFSHKMLDGNLFSPFTPKPGLAVVSFGMFLSCEGSQCVCS